VVDQPVAGCKYWCVEEVMEDDLTGGLRAPHEPWQGILELKEAGRCGPVMFLHHFDDGDQPDYDSNATAIVTKLHLYATHAEAEAEYEDRLFQFMRAAAEAVTWAGEKLQDLKDRRELLPGDSKVDRGE
jgi:hypothetical protein